MKYLHLLRQHLKSDDLIDLLETYDIEVIYLFDRTHENLPDEYWAKCPEQGFELLFDADQVLKTIFIHASRIDGFEPAELVGSDVQKFDS